MHRLSILLVVAAACGGPSKPATETTTTTGPGPAEEHVVGPPEVAWKDMSKEQRGKYMAKVVMPKMKPMFVAFDEKGFKDFDCKTCHGSGADNKTFKMPNPDIFVLPPNKEGFEALAKEKPDWMKFMGGQVEPEMAKLLGLEPYNPAAPDPSQFTCMGCHTKK